MEWAPFDPRQFSPVEPLQGCPPLPPVGTTLASLLAALGPRIRGLTVYSSQGAYQVSVSLDEKNTWHIEKGSDLEQTMVACLWGTAYYRL